MEGDGLCWYCQPQVVLVYTNPRSRWWLGLGVVCVALTLALEVRLRIEENETWSPKSELFTVAIFRNGSEWRYDTVSLYQDGFPRVFMRI